MPDAVPFSLEVRQRTQKVHSETESSTFIAELMRGERGLDDYVALVGQQYFVYATLEEVAETLSAHAVAGPFLSPHLTRLPAIESDLDFLTDGSWRDSLAPLPATDRYVARIREMEAWPGGYIAHHYTRYLGDLSGGQAIRSLLQRQFGLGGSGVDFYLFPGIEKPKLFKDAYRQLLDSVVWSAAERGLVIAEVDRAFRHNAEVLADLESATR